MIISAKKILSSANLVRVLARMRRKGLRIVFTNGCFDLIHVGHLKVFEWCKKQGDVLIVGINSDRSVRRLKGSKRPILPERDRAQLLAGFATIDYVTIFSEDTPAKLIQLIQPDVLVKGGDWSADQIVGRENAGKVVRVPLVKGRSTTAIIKLIANRYGCT